jgi:hypothetical protein
VTGSEPRRLAWLSCLPVVAFVLLGGGLAFADAMSGSVDVPPGGSLRDPVMDLLVPAAQDVIGAAVDRGRRAALKDVDLWTGDNHFSRFARGCRLIPEGVPRMRA